MMTLREWLERHEIREETAARKIQELAKGEYGCTVYAIRKWITGERIPRPKMQAIIMHFTGNAVTPNDWVLGTVKPRKQKRHSRKASH